MALPASRLKARRKGGRRRLRSGVPRVYADHRRRVALAYRGYVQALLARHPGEPDAIVLATAREAGLVNADLERLAAEAEALHGKPRVRRELARIQRRRIALRSQLLALERRLEELAQRNGGPSLREYLAVRYPSGGDGS